MSEHSYLLPMLVVVVVALLAVAIYGGIQSRQADRRLERSEQRSRPVEFGKLKQGDVFWFESPDSSHWYVTAAPTIKDGTAQVLATVGGNLTPRPLVRNAEHIVHVLPRPESGNVLT